LSYSCDRIRIADVRFFQEKLALMKECDKTQTRYAEEIKHLENNTIRTLQQKVPSARIFVA
jgi:hypothetical protein